jgi:hypothetical protein
MKNILKYLLPIAAVLILLAAPVSVYAHPEDQTTGNLSGDQVLFGQNFTLQTTQTLNGDLVAFGGSTSIETGANIFGDLILLGGNLNLVGTVNGDVVAVGANVTLEKGALITGQIVSVGGIINGTDLGTIRGGIQTFTPQSLLFDRNAFSFNPPDSSTSTQTFGGWVFNFLTRVMQILAMAVLAVIVLLIIPQPTRRTADSIANQPWMSIGAGFLALLASPLVLIILTITIILIPVTILAVLAIAVALIYGWIAIAMLIGQRMEIIFKTQWADAVSTGLGTLVLGIVVWILGYVPCIGWLIGLIAGCAGLGGVILSGFGTRAAAPTRTAPPAEVVTIPPASPAPTVSSDTPESTEPPQS